MTVSPMPRGPRTASLISTLANAQVTLVGSTISEKKISRRPFEGELAAMTLWPEVEKVFGHGYEVRGLLFSHFNLA